MADSQVILQLASGKSIRGFIKSSAAAGSYVPLDRNGPANANSPEEVMFSADDFITDVFFTAASGTVELVANNEPTTIMFDAAPNHPTNAGRQRFSVKIYANVQYRMRVVAPFPA